MSSPSSVRNPDGATDHREQADLAIGEALQRTFEEVGHVGSDDRSNAFVSSKPHRSR